MEQILDAIQAGATGDELAALPLPDYYRAAFVRRDEVAMFDGVESADKDPRRACTSTRWRRPSWRPTRCIWR